MKIVSVNIEGKKHIEKVTALIQKENPDILFLQEICKGELGIFSALMSGDRVFAPMAYKDTLEDTIGIATFSSLTAKHTVHLLKEADKTLPSYTDASFEEQFRSQSYYTIETVVTDYAGNDLRFYNIHLPVTEAGTTTGFQLEVIDNLFKTLTQKKDVILIGDSNAPRGGEAFSRIAKKYKDNVPNKHTTSIDGSLHRAGYLERMVDILFTTPGYLVKEFRFVEGISDHFAMVAEIERV